MSPWGKTPVSSDAEPTAEMIDMTGTREVVVADQETTGNLAASEATVMLEDYAVIEILAGSVLIRTPIDPEQGGMEESAKL